MLKDFEVEALTSPRACLERAQQGLGDVDAVIIHKDLGAHTRDRREWSPGVTAERVINAIHEEAPHVRVGIASGEYPHGKKEVLSMGADLYCGHEDMIEDWFLDQLRRGSVSPGEQAKRGKTIEQPPEERWGYGIERR